MTWIRYKIIVVRPPLRWPELARRELLCSFFV